MEFEKLYIDYKNKYHQLKKIQKGGMNPKRPESIRDEFTPTITEGRTRREEQRLQLEQQQQQQQQEQEAACNMQQKRELLLALHERDQRILEQELQQKQLELQQKQLELEQKQRQIDQILAMERLAWERQTGQYQERFAPGQGGPLNLGSNRIRIDFREFDTAFDPEYRG